MQSIQGETSAAQPSAKALEPVVRAVKLSKRFKKSLAVNEAEFEVYQGDVFGLLGPNGAGKTTIIRMLLGLIKPSAGRAEVFGYDPFSERAEVLRRVSAIVEAPALYPTLTGRANLHAMALAAGLSNPGRKIEEVLDRMGLAGRANDKYQAYSLGLKQRLSIAATLLTDPQLVILDEPTNGLDPAGMAEIRQLIRELAGQGRTILLSSHLLSEVQQVCNRVVILKRGQVIQQGLVSDLLGSRTFIRLQVKPQDRERAWHLLETQGWAGRLEAERGSDYILVDWPSSDSAILNEALASNGIYAREVTPGCQSLEEYYLKLTGETFLEESKQRKGKEGYGKRKLFRRG